MAHGAGSGDRLARGAVKVSYLTTEKSISQSAWDRMFENYDSEKFMKEEKPKVEGAKEKTKSR